MDPATGVGGGDLRPEGIGSLVALRTLFRFPRDSEAQDPAHSHRRVNGGFGAGVAGVGGFPVDPDGGLDGGVVAPPSGSSGTVGGVTGFGGTSTGPGRDGMTAVPVPVLGALGTLVDRRTIWLTTWPVTGAEFSTELTTPIEGWIRCGFL